MTPIDFSVFEFSPIIDMGEDYTVLDFSAGPGSFQKPKTTYSIGKYNEKRPGMCCRAVRCKAGISTG